MKRALWIIPAVVLFCFTVVSFATQKDYGWNWDMFQHMARGQAYFRFFTTGKTDNTGVIPYQGRISYFEKTPFDFRWASNMTIGHPPATDILLAAWNQLLYKRFGLVEDTTSYLLHGVVVALLAALCILLWSYELGGWVGASVSVVAYMGFPLLFAEQHFNFKDPAITGYNIIFLYMFWLGITRKNFLYLFVASVIAGISMGTKFNILFLAPLIPVWMMWYTKGRPVRWWRTTRQAYKCMLLSIPIIMVAIFFATYPALWNHPIKNTFSVIQYYRDIGGSRCPYIPMTGLWFIRCTDWQTIRLFFVTIPTPTLLLTGIGMFMTFMTLGTYRLAPLLWFLYAAAVILRVAAPVTSLYGGSLRQITEFIGPVALLAGFGTARMYRMSGMRRVIVVVIVLLYIPVFWTMVKIHPNENLYTNSIADIFWKQSKQEFVNGTVAYGNAYKPAVDWVNTHAPYGVKVTLAVGILSAIPRTEFRSDIDFGGSPSGYDMRGEYLIEQVADLQDPQFFPYLYANRILLPEYEKIVEGFPIVRVWKNDAVHVRSDFRKTIPVAIEKVVWGQHEVVVRLEHTARIQSLAITTDNVACRNSVMNAYILVSPDGISYHRLYETVQQLAGSDSGIIRYPLSGEPAAFVKLFFFGNDDCNAALMHIEVTGFT